MRTHREAKEKPIARAGYVYVLSTSYVTKGTPIVKIGRTTRSPSERIKELSRGGPTGMNLVGAVTTRDSAELERLAHWKFRDKKFSGNGGTEYFATDPSEVLSWLRSETPRFELESARKDAWAEYVDTAAFRMNAFIQNIPFFVLIYSPWPFLLWQPFEWWKVFVLPLILCAVAIGVMRVLKKHIWKTLDTELALLRSKLEAKYHLPAGGIRSSL